MQGSIERHRVAAIDTAGDGERRRPGIRRATQCCCASSLHRGAAQGDDVEIDGQTWQSWFDEQDQALVLEQDDVTTLVVGTVDQATVVDFVDSLR